MENSNMGMAEMISPGIHSSAEEIILTSFSEEEKKICNVWKQDWYITFAKHHEMSNSQCNFIVVKPTERLQETLGISKEIIVLLIDYPTFEARSLDFFDSILGQFSSKNRLEKICYALISSCKNIEREINNHLSGQESQIVIPFTYESFSLENGGTLILKQFRKYFYSRDLFGINDPLKKEYYFFARDNLSMRIIDKHKNGLNAGLFGLRKSGKTSVLYDIIRKSESCDVQSVYIDCQDTSFNMCHWNIALKYTLEKAYNQSNCDFYYNDSRFSEEKASDSFEEGIRSLADRLHKSVLLLFDEIENITPEKSSSPYWCSGLDFIYFWQSIRSIFQRTNNVFTYCIMGTNPRCVEVPSFSGKDNPIYNAFVPEYIQGFSQKQTREMVRKLGRLMGMKFDEEVYTHLTEEYGGHPFLIRQVCSRIAHRFQDRPVQIDRARYATIKEEFNRENTYYDMLLEVLVQYYPDEYEMLKLLATNDYQTFNDYASMDYSMIAHLIGYSIINETEDGTFEFRIDALKQYIIRKINKPVLSQTLDEQWKEICASRNTIETELRKMVKVVLRFNYKSEADAKIHVIEKVFGNSSDKKRAAAKEYSTLFDPKESKIFLKNLHTLIKCNYESFQEFFGPQEQFNLAMDVLNSEGRFDAHAKEPTENDIDSYNMAIKRIKEGLEKYKKSLE